jgi:hypothetical protein
MECCMNAEARGEHHGTGRAGFPGSTDRSARFLRRIDAYLPSLPDARARRLFLDRQIAGWEHRYARFISTEGGFEPVLDPANPPQAADFLITIVGLARRRGASRSIIGDAMISDLDRRRLDGAVLSLLVAADQRCPAIIGQAHLLYHSDGNTMRARTEQALSQLRRDAQDLLDAIAGVEVAVRAALPE